jgi:glutamine amidotransferase
MTNIIIVDYDMGNVGSIANMIKKLGQKALITSEQTAIQQADKLILPGVGAFDTGMQNLDNLGLLPVLNKKVLHQKVPVLGICLGMQLLTQKSEEGKLPGLGWIEAETVKFNFEQQEKKLRIPHMGWNTIQIKREHSLFSGLNNESRFYFVHSYYVKCRHQADILTETEYGFAFTSAFQYENVFGVQFHPEKSHKFGMQLYRNFLNL